MAIPGKCHPAEQVERPFSLAGRKLARVNQPPKRRGAFEVDRVRGGQFLAHDGSADLLGDAIRSNQELHDRRGIENYHVRDSRIAVIASTTSSAVTSERAAMVRACSAASSGVRTAASLSSSCRTYACNDWPAWAARTLRVVTARSETSRT